jgi:hypothetical protein
LITVVTSAVGGIRGSQPRSVEPDRLPVALVEGDEAVRRLSHFAPADNHGAGDHEAAVQSRKIGPSAVGAQEAVLFAQRVRPKGLAGFTVDALEIAVHSLGIDVARGGIADNA